MKVLFWVNFILFISNSAPISAAAVQKDFALSYLSDRTDCQLIYSSVYFCGTTQQIQEAISLVEQTRALEVGEKTWQEILASKKNLLIAQSDSAVLSAAKTLAPLSTALSDGRGRSAVVLFNFDIPKSGSHRVGGTKEEWTEFTKLQNFFHELVHAKHYMQGTAIMPRLEEQVIELENVFRQQQAPSNLNLRSLDYEKGEQIWYPVERS
jgi:hypothetical protein